MIKKVIDINGYWKVIVYYNINYNLFYIIDFSLNRIGCTKNQIKSIYNNMHNGGAKAVTISSINKKMSIVLFNKHDNYYDYINSVVHEAEHIKQSMLYSYYIEDKDEVPAYTIGYIASQMLKFLL